MALSIRCSEIYGIINRIFRKKTPDTSHLFERNQHLLSDEISSTQEWCRISGRTRLWPWNNRPEKMLWKQIRQRHISEKNDRSVWTLTSKNNILFIKSSYIYQNNYYGEPTFKQKNVWFVCCCYCCWLPHLIVSWPGTALPDSRHLPGHDAPLPLRNWWTASWRIENNHSLGTCNGRLVFQRVHYRSG